MAHRTQPLSSSSTARSRLAALGEKKPRTKAAQIRSLWPEIKAALDNGHTLKAVCDCLEADGLEMSIYTLGSYVARMRRNVAPDLHAAQMPHSRASVAAVLTDEKTSNSNHEQGSPDPLANLRKSQTKRATFDYRPELADPDKLI